MVELFSQSETILLIGNGPSATQNESGSRVDSFDQVIRFNQYKVTGYEKQLGSKTTVWATFGKDQYPQATEPPAKVIMAHEYGHLRCVNGSSIWRIPHVFYQKLRIELTATDPKKIPSTGYLVARWLLSLGYSFTLLGFDHFQKQTTGKHHYWNDKKYIAPPEHDGNRERDLLLPFVNSGKIRYFE